MANMLLASFVAFASLSVALGLTCTIVVPPNGLSAAGLSTPYIVKGCDQTNPAQASFVEAVIVNTVTATLRVYNPLLINSGTTPLVAPVVPSIGANDVVGIWIGSNADVVVLENTAGTFSISDAACLTAISVNGVISRFGKMASCNYENFYAAANMLIAQGRIKVPALKLGLNGKPCYTTRSFAVVDQGQSDNVVSKYLGLGGRTAQFNAANKAKYPTAVEISNDGDNRLLNTYVLPALGCSPWSVTDIVDAGKVRGALALNELQAAAYQAQPVALIPYGHQMALVNGAESPSKTTLLRHITNQPTITVCYNKPTRPTCTLPDTNANTTLYCGNIINVGLPAILADKPYTVTKAWRTAGVNLYQFLLTRLNTTLGSNGLNCLALLNIANPVCQYIAC